MRMMSNTTQQLPCVLCGSTGNIVREAQNPEQCRVKCNNPGCNHTYSKKDSLDAQIAGQIPDGPPQLDDPNPPATEIEEKTIQQQAYKHEALSVSQRVNTVIPRTITHVVVSRDRSKAAWCNSKNLKRTILEWETAGKSYEVFELNPKKVSAKIDIQ